MLISYFQDSSPISRNYAVSTPGTTSAYSSVNFSSDSQLRVGNRQRAPQMKLAAKEKIILGDGAQTDSKSYPGTG